MAHISIVSLGAGERRGKTNALSGTVETGYNFGLYFAGLDGSALMTSAKQFGTTLLCLSSVARMPTAPYGNIDPVRAETILRTDCQVVSIKRMPRAT